jgi:Putative bacterial sensory transduction regulator
MALQTASSDEMTAQTAETEGTSNLVEVIETVIDSLDSDNTAMVNRSESGHIWKFKYGTVEVFVQLTGLADEDSLTVWASVLKLPAKDEAKLTRHLLERNWQNTLEARFGIFDNQVVVLATRSLADLSPGEISRAITIVATIADESDEPLQAEFAA